MLKNHTNPDREKLTPRVAICFSKGSEEVQRASSSFSFSLMNKEMASDWQLKLSHFKHILSSWMPLEDKDITLSSSDNWLTRNNYSQTE